MVNVSMADTLDSVFTKMKNERSDLMMYESSRNMMCVSVVIEAMDYCDKVCMAKLKENEEQEDSSDNIYGVVKSMKTSMESIALSVFAKNFSDIIYDFFDKENISYRNFNNSKMSALIQYLDSHIGDHLTRYDIYSSSKNTSVGEFNERDLTPAVIYGDCMKFLSKNTCSM